jgi:BirA family transcriptional regulator, biotin operon repressor / biotin---[acetyl-CoA-carboxylase] ligase
MIFDVEKTYALIAGTRFARIRYVARTGSTNDDAQELLGAPGSAGLVLLAEHQQAGKGRRARPWIAPAGSSLLFTALLPDPIPTAALWAVPFWTGLTIAHAVEKNTGLRPALQWPNDLLLGEHKCCGILAVSRVAGNRASVGCGVGLNVRRPKDGASLAEIEPKPAFISDRVATVEREALLAAILRSFDGRLGMLEDPAGIARAWESRAELKGSRYRIALDVGETFEAEAQRIDDDGSLIVRAADRERRVAMADARVLR